jgi:hypothetical protein
VVEQLAFDRGEEGFGKGVVPALASTAEGQYDVVIAGQGGEGGGCVLAALSLWKITPGAGSRAARALASAALTSSVRK